MAEPTDYMASQQDNQTSQSSHGDYLSVPSSPTATRRPLRPGMSRRQSSYAGGPDERSPLLQSSRSRMRIPSAHGTFRAPDLTRNQSYTG